MLLCIWLKPRHCRIPLCPEVRIEVVSTLSHVMWHCQFVFHRRLWTACEVYLYFVLCLYFIAFTTFLRLGHLLYHYRSVSVGLHVCLFQAMFYLMASTEASLRCTTPVGKYAWTPINSYPWVSVDDWFQGLPQI